MWIVWLVIAIVFAIAELMTTTLTLIWFSIAAVILIFLSRIITSIFIQVVIFAIISTVLLVLATKKFVKNDEKYKYNTNLQAIIDKTGVVEETIYPNKTGIVVVDGEQWSSISFNNEIINQNDVVRVIKIEGVKLIVEKIK